MPLAIELLTQLIVILQRKQNNVNTFERKEILKQLKMILSLLQGEMVYK